jgi:hypothetical protein
MGMTLSGAKPHLVGGRLHAGFDEGSVLGGERRREAPAKLEWDHRDVVEDDQAG